MSQLARNWWIPADGIDRSVISADIQRYLGNDATVRPGTGNAPGEEVGQRATLREHMLTTSRASTDTGSGHTETLRLYARTCKGESCGLHMLTMFQLRR